MRLALGLVLFAPVLLLACGDGGAADASPPERCNPPVSPRRYYIEQTPIPGSNTGLYSCDVPFVDAVLEMKAPGMETDPGSCTPSNVRIDGAGCTVESEYRCLELPYAGGLWLTNASYTCRDPGCEELVGVALVQQFYGTETASQLRCSAEHEITLFEIFP